jgi:H+/gluconate symporter-like permease
MQTIVEDLSEEMKREREEEMRAGRGAPAIAFFDLAAMGKTGSLIYLGGIVAFFAIIFYVLYQKLFIKPVDFKQQKKVERQQKKASSKGPGSKKTN